MDGCRGKQGNLAKRKKCMSGNVIINGYFGIEVLVFEIISGLPLLSYGHY